MVSFSEKWRGWSFGKKLLVINLFVFVGVLVLGMALIAPDCTFDCEARGELVGRGLAQLLVFINLMAGIVYFLKKNKTK
jgi:hypothetical protein